MTASNRESATEGEVEDEEPVIRDVASMSAQLEGRLFMDSPRLRSVVNCIPQVSNSTVNLNSNVQWWSLPSVGYLRAYSNMKRWRCFGCWWNVCNSTARLRRCLFCQQVWWSWMYHLVELASCLGLFNFILELTQNEGFHVHFTITYLFGTSHVSAWQVQVD